MRAMFLGPMVCSGVEFDIQRTVGGVGGSHTITLPDGTYYWSRDAASDDLADALQDLIRAAHADFTGFRVSCSADDGKISLQTGAGTVVITWGSDGEELRDWMRLSGSTTTVTAGGVTAARTAAYAYYPERALVEDLPSIVESESIATADDGTTEAHHYGSAGQRDMTIQFAGYPEGAAWNEHEAVRDFWSDVWSQGKVFRYYKDSTVLTAWARVTNPNGYRSFQKLTPKDFQPSALRAGWYGMWQLAMLLVEV